MGGLTAGDEYDVLDVAGRMYLDGDLIVLLIDGFHPKAGDSFTILGLNARPIGVFSTLDLPGGADDWDVSSLYTDGSLTYIAAGLISGDADGDGFVDDDDLSLLLANWGGDVGWDHGNFNGDSTVDDDDLSLLLANWTGSQPVPEPMALSLLAVGGLTLLRRKRR